MLHLIIVFAVYQRTHLMGVTCRVKGPILIIQYKILYQSDQDLTAALRGHVKKIFISFPRHKILFPQHNYLVPTR